MNINRALILTLTISMLLTACAGSAPATDNPASAPTEEQAAPTDESDSAPPPTATSEPITLKMNSSTLTSFAPIFIADAEGFFKDEGITVEFITLQRTNDAVPLIINGDLDIYAGSVNAGILNILRQEPSVKVVADRGHISVEDACTYQGLLIRKDLYEGGQVTKPEDMKGKNIATTTTGPSGYLLSSYLAQAGLTMKDVNIIDLPPAGYIDAMANGSIDGLVGPELRLSQVLNAGNAVLLAGTEDVVGNFQSSVLVFGKSLLEDDRGAAVRYLRAYLRGVEQYNEGKTERNLAIMAQYTGETEDTLKAACWVTISNDGMINFAQSVLPFVEWNISQGDLDETLTEDQFWDPSLVEQAYSQIH